MRDTIETNRLSLRPFASTDAARVTELVGDWNVARMLARVPHPYDRTDADAWIAGASARRDTGAAFEFAVCTAKDGVIGAISLDRRDKSPDLTLGYWIGKPFWGQGYASEAGGALLAYATEDMGRAPFRSEHFVDNDASGKVLRKLGFAYTGEVRKMHCLARDSHVPARLMERTTESGGGHAS